MFGLDATIMEQDSADATIIEWDSVDATSIIRNPFKDFWYNGTGQCCQEVKAMHLFSYWDGSTPHATSAGVLHTDLCIHAPSNLNGTRSCNTIHMLGFSDCMHIKLTKHLS